MEEYLSPDGKTPLKNCKIEIWQCDANKIYDNTSDEYKYRGTQYTDKDGKYNFITTHPVPYPATEIWWTFRKRLKLHSAVNQR